MSLALVQAPNQAIVLVPVLVLVLLASLKDQVQAPNQAIVQVLVMVLILVLLAILKDLVQAPNQAISQVLVLLLQQKVWIGKPVSHMFDVNE